MITKMVSQRLLNSILNTPSRGISNRIKLAILNKLRKKLVHKVDPLVRYRLCGNDILLPLSHGLPYFRKAFPEYSTNVARIAGIVKGKYNDLTFIDIGANIGDTLTILRGVAHFPILCIECEDRYFEILQKNSSNYSDISLENHSLVALPV